MHGGVERKIVFTGSFSEVTSSSCSIIKNTCSSSKNAVPSSAWSRVVIFYSTFLGSFDFIVF